MSNEVTNNVRASGNVRVESSQAVTPPKKDAEVKSSVTNATNQTNVSQERAVQAEQNNAPVNRQAVTEAVASLNQAVQDIRREIKFSVQEDTGQTIITVLDEASEEVIRQIPSEEVVKMAQFLKELDSQDKEQAQVMNGLILQLQA